MISDRLLVHSYKLQRTKYVRVINGGLIMIVPVLMIGAFALIFMSFPLPAYIDFIKTFAGGILYNIFDMVYRSTFGILSVYMTISLSYNYTRESGMRDVGIIGGVFTSLAVFIMLSGVYSPAFEIEDLGAKGMVSAIFCGYFVCFLFCRVYALLPGGRRVYSDGADLRFNRIVDLIFPGAIVIMACTIVIRILGNVLNVSTLPEFINRVVDKAFLSVQSNFLVGFLFVLVSSLLWFFGIHGSDCLEQVMTTVFVPNIDVNIAAVAAGNAPTEILTKPFFNVFVLMGGCGSAICLLIAICLFGKRRGEHGLARISALPMLFNINEVMLFGLPVILNPIMFIPFILTPIVCYLSSYFAIYSGLVGMTVTAVEWTTPVFIGGYAATGGVPGMLLQLFNIILGVAIYAPFIRISDKQKSLAMCDNYKKLVEYYKSIEESDSNIMLTSLHDERGNTAKSLAAELNAWIKECTPTLAYQPQYAYDGSCFGVEALLRWRHPELGTIYPPLVIKLADELGRLSELEKNIIKKAISDIPDIRARLGNVEMSINISGSTLPTEGFTDFLRETVDGVSGVYLEITEQTALHFNDETSSLISEIRAMGVRFAIDDFSMGQTSIAYLKDKQFDLVKLDGSLVRDVQGNERCYDIVRTIVELSKSLEFSVLAEYVETEELRDKLYQAGCVLYQGYLYSPALPKEKLGEPDGVKTRGTVRCKA